MFSLLGWSAELIFRHFHARENEHTLSRNFRKERLAFISIKIATQVDFKVTIISTWKNASSQLGDRVALVSIMKLSRKRTIVFIYFIFIYGLTHSLYFRTKHAMCKLHLL